MAKITLKGNPIETVGELPKVGKKASNFKLVKSDLSIAKLEDYKGTRIVLNITPSIDTAVCATSIRKFNELATQFDNTKVLYISKDLPFAHARFCGAEGIDNVETLSDFVKGKFGKKYGVTISTGPMKGLLSRAIVVINEEGTVIYNEQVPEIVDEPNYDKVIEILK